MTDKLSGELALNRMSVKDGVDAIVEQIPAVWKNHLLDLELWIVRKGDHELTYYRSLARSKRAYRGYRETRPQCGFSSAGEKRTAN